MPKGLLLSFSRLVTVAVRVPFREGMDMTGQLMFREGNI